jgi:very-short-patch-repair endonuclease
VSRPGLRVHFQRAMCLDEVTIRDNIPITTLVRKAQLRDPEINVPVHGYEVDFLWRAERFVVEIDGRAFHSSDRAFESDRRRDGVLLASGMRVMRVTWHQIAKEPEALLTRLVRALIVASS